MQATYPIDNSSLVHTTATRQTARAKLLLLELHKLTTKQEQQQVKQEDNKVSAREDLECYTEG
jgi:hypothetical protein